MSTNTELVMDPRHMSRSPHCLEIGGIVIVTDQSKDKIPNKSNICTLNKPFNQRSICLRTCSLLGNLCITFSDFSYSLQVFLPTRQNYG